MTALAPDRGTRGTTALEAGFPVAEISALAERESWRKEINRPLYHIHKWWATRLGSVFRGITLGALTEAGSDIWEGFYKTHNLKDKVVLDPFMGSGTTLGEALKLGARAIGCDINPVSTFMVRQALTAVEEAKLRRAFAMLEAEVAPEIRRYYQTRDPLTGRGIPVLYYFWCKTVTTPAGDIVPLFSRYVFAQHACPTKKPDAWTVCSNCWDIFQSRYDSAWAVCPHCGSEFNPLDGPAKGQYVRARDGSRHKIRDLLPKDGSPPSHRLYAVLALRPDGRKIYLAAKPVDHALYAEASARLEEEDLPLPTLAVRPGHNTDQARNYNYTRWRDFFNARQLLCLGLLLRQILKIEDEPVQEQMLCLFSSTLEFNNLFCSYKGEGTGAVRHMFSNHILKPERVPVENSVWGTAKSSGTFSTLFESRLLRAKRYLKQPFELELRRDLFGVTDEAQKLVASTALNPTCVTAWEDLWRDPRAVMVLNGDSARLPLRDESVDAIVTDPPYFDFVHYSELSDFFFAWLAPVLGGRHAWMRGANCFDTGEVQHRDPRAFADQLARVFSECRRVMKAGAVLAFSFHHSRPEGWAAIHEAVRAAGLCVVAAHVVHAELRVASPKAAARDPINVDAILVCRKREGLHRGAPARRVSRESADGLEAVGHAGRGAGRADRFVVAAAQTLVEDGESVTSYEEMLDRVSAVFERLMRGPRTGGREGAGRRGGRSGWTALGDGRREELAAGQLRPQKRDIEGRDGRVERLHLEDHH